MSKKVDWGNVYSRDYSRITYGNTWLLGLDWDYKNNLTYSIDAYENNNIKPENYFFKELNYLERKQLHQNIINYDYSESHEISSSDCKCTIPNFSKIKPKNIKLLLKSYNCKNISNNNDDNLNQLKQILKDETCLCLFNKNCQCYKLKIECISTCACKMKCKNNYDFYKQK